MIGFLSLAGDEWEIACTVVQRAQRVQMEQRAEEHKAMTKTLAAAVGVATGNAVGRALGG